MKYPELLFFSIVSIVTTQTGGAQVGGYVNTNAASGYSLVNVALGRNPAESGGLGTQTLSSYFSTNLPSGSVVQKYSHSSYDSFTYNATAGWTDSTGLPAGNVPMAVGEGLVLLNPGSAFSYFSVGYAYGYALPQGQVLERAPVVPPPPGIYLRGSIFPVGPVTFAEIMGRAPLVGDAVLTLNQAGTPLISRYGSFGWTDPLGGSITPTFSETQSAFFDTTGTQFRDFVLPSGAVVPEPGSAGLLMLAMLRTVTRRRRSGS